MNKNKQNSILVKQEKYSESKPILMLKPGIDKDDVSKSQNIL